MCIDKKSLKKIMEYEYFCMTPSLVWNEIYILFKAKHIHGHIWKFLYGAAQYLYDILILGFLSVIDYILTLLNNKKLLVRDLL